MLPWVAVRVHDLTGDDLGIALVPWPVELGDEIAVDGQGDLENPAAVARVVIARRAATRFR